MLHNRVVYANLAKGNEKHTMTVPFLAAMGKVDTTQQEETLVNDV